MTTRWIDLPVERRPEAAVLAVALVLNAVLVFGVLAWALGQGPETMTVAGLVGMAYSIPMSLFLFRRVQRIAH